MVLKNAVLPGFEVVVKNGLPAVYPVNNGVVPMKAWVALDSVLCGLVPKIPITANVTAPAATRRFVFFINVCLKFK